MLEAYPPCPGREPVDATPENPRRPLAGTIVDWHVPSLALDRLNWYEAALWRQVAQTLSHSTLRSA
jgi:hypothetical protein